MSDSYNDTEIFCRKLARIISKDFPSGFTARELIAHPEINEEDLEVIEWHANFGASNYSFNHVHCQCPIAPPLEQRFEVHVDTQHRKTYIERRKRDGEKESRIYA